VPFSADTLLQPKKDGLELVVTAVGATSVVVVGAVVRVFGTEVVRLIIRLF
jgi:hypothetical protein